MVGIIVSFWYFTSDANAIVRCLANSQFANVKKIYTQINVSGSDDRTIRDPRDNPDREAAQGRTYCLDEPLPKGKIPSRQFLQENGFTSNAVLAFADDVVIFNRHDVKGPDGKAERRSPTNCYFEHLDSGEIIQFADAVVPENPNFANAKTKSDKSIWTNNDDYGLALLSKKPKNGKFIPREKIVANSVADKNAKLTVWSNYAINNANGMPNDRTVTQCNPAGRYKANGILTNTVSTPCDTGDGSSGAQVYLDDDKFIGIITGQTVTPDGSEFNPSKHATFFTRFDEKIFEKYDELEARRAK